MRLIDPSQKQLDLDIVVVEIYFALPLLHLGTAKAEQMYVAEATREEVTKVIGAAIANEAALAREAKGGGDDANPHGAP